MLFRSDIYGLAQAFDNIDADKNMLQRHAAVANATRTALIEAGIHLHLQSGFCNTVTVFDVPQGLTADQILDGMKAGGIMLAGSFDDLSGKVIRIGHMGANANIGDMVETLRLLDKVLRSLGVDLKAKLDTIFINNLELY